MDSSQTKLSKTLKLSKTWTMDDHGAFMFHRLPSIYIGDHRFTTIYIQLMVYMVVIYGLPIVEMVVYHGKHHNSSHHFHL
jgi:hypothetical protein